MKYSSFMTSKMSRYQTTKNKDYLLILQLLMSARPQLAALNDDID